MFGRRRLFYPTQKAPTEPHWFLPIVLYLALLAGVFCLAMAATPARAVETQGYIAVDGCGGALPSGYSYVVGQPGLPTFDKNTGKVCDAATVGSVVVSLNDAASTPASGTVTLGGTFQSIITASGTRKGCLVENPSTASEPLYVFFGANGSATTGNSISLGAGQSVICGAPGIVADDNVSVTATTTGHAFVAFYQ